MLKTNELRASDLRLGNWVWNEVQNMPVKVDMRILQDQIYADKGFKEGWKPIPLTEEILLRCGFVIEDPILMYFSHREIVGILQLFDGVAEYSIDSNDVCWVNNLHQLQNLFFAISEMELEINL